MADNSVNDNVPRRYIYNQADMEHFRHSSARKELLSFVSAMGRGLTTTIADQSLDDDSTTTFDTTPRPISIYSSHSPLTSLTPALASLHGSLSCISNTWMDQDNDDGIPIDRTVKARFGNPAFRTWHARLVDRSYAIIRCLMDCHVKHVSSSDTTTSEDEMVHILSECSKQGYRAASEEGTSLWPPAMSSSKQEEVIGELRAYLHDSFGHPIRIDYGTGHESSFVVFLLSLCKIGCFRWGGRNNSNDNGDGEIKQKNKSNPPPQVIGHASLSLFHVYLNVARGLQRDYMLEPAGSHGVWGLDDYHCIPFYLGACQMMARDQSQKQRRDHRKKMGAVVHDVIRDTDKEREDDSTNMTPDNPYLPNAASSAEISSSDTKNDDDDRWTPSIIHDLRMIETHSPTYIYLSCIQFIRQIKPSAPFFEASPMLNDISQLETWSKVAAGLLRLYEGEVLNKMPVVQHFVFGKIFSADWIPSRTAPLEAPKKTFSESPLADGGGSTQAPPTAYPGGMPPTRAPWAK